jgi:hypothetical protein
MSELKAITVYDAYWKANSVGEGTGILVYLKSEADKVIADLEMKLAAAKLVLRLNEPKALYSNLDTISRLNHKIDVVERRELHQKYKRCLAMAQEWRSYASFCGIQSSWHNNRGFGKTAEKYTWKECHAWRCVKRWRALAEKFKEAK